MATKSTGGRPSVYSPKDGDKTYRALALTKKGQTLFERARKELQVVNPAFGRVSDSDVIDYVVRAWESWNAPKQKVKKK